MTQLLTKTKRKVLVIDDSLMARKLIVSYLSNGDYEIYESKTGREGLAVASDIHPDLILLDFVMPGMNGYEVYQALRSQVEFQSTPVILFSSNYDEVVKKFGFPFEGFEFLHKHATNQQVLSCIDTLLSEADSERSLDTAPLQPTRPSQIQDLEAFLSESAQDAAAPNLLKPSSALQSNAEPLIDQAESATHPEHRTNDIADALANLGQPQPLAASETPAAVAGKFDNSAAALLQDASEDSFSIDADPTVHYPIEEDTGIEYSEVSTSNEDLSRKMVQTAMEVSDQATTIRTLERKIDGLGLQVDQLQTRLDKYMDRERPTPSLWTWLMLVTVISAVVGTLTGSLLLRPLEKSPNQAPIPPVEAPLPTNPGQ